MSEKKPKSPLEQIPTRKLVSGIKQDLKQMARAARTSIAPVSKRKTK
jgi:hypothetical protein